MHRKGQRRENIWGRTPKVTYRYTYGIDREEEKVDSATKLGNANGPYLSNNDAPDRAARRSEIQTAGTVRCWKDLRCVKVLASATL